MQSTRPARGISRSRPSHVKACFWIDKELDGQLGPDEKVMDIAFRGFATAHGPSGWGIVIDFGGGVTHGITLPTMARPSRKMVRNGLLTARALIQAGRTDATEKALAKRMRPKVGELAELTRKSGLGTQGQGS